MIARNPLPSAAPGDFPSRRWDQLRRDVTDFLASPWAEEAARFGWTDLDLFGVDADRPYTRIEGPVWCWRSTQDRHTPRPGRKY